VLQTTAGSTRERELGCVHIDMSTSSALSGYPSCISVAWLIGALLVRVECSQSLIQEHNSSPVGHIEWNRIEEMLRK